MMEEQNRDIFEEIEKIESDVFDSEDDELFELDEAEGEEELNGGFDLDLGDEGDPDEEFDDSLDLDLDDDSDFDWDDEEDEVDWEDEDDEEAEWDPEPEPSQSQSLKDFAGDWENRWAEWKWMDDHNR